MILHYAVTNREFSLVRERGTIMILQSSLQIIFEVGGSIV